MKNGEEKESGEAPWEAWRLFLFKDLSFGFFF